VFHQSFSIYDAIYRSRGKDYADEAAKIDQLIREYKRSPGNRLLDIACGTGGHLAYLQNTYTVEGLDLEEGMLEVARARFPHIPFYQGSMIDFDLGRRFDTIICLFSAIGYVQTIENLEKTIANMARHLEPGGVLILEPSFTPDYYRVGSVHGSFVDEPELKIARMVISEQEGNIAVLNFHYLVASPAGIEHFTELHKMALFTNEEYMSAFHKVGLVVDHDPVGLIGRGLHICRVPLETPPH
jgi:SAM-dependent methyltransferase